MLDGYNRMFWQQAQRSVTRIIDIPDAALGIDAAGYDDSLSVGLAYQAHAKTPAKMPIVTDVLDSTSKGWNQAVKPKDFPNTGYYGDFTQGW